MPEYHIPAQQVQPQIDPVTGEVKRNPAQEGAPKPAGDSPQPKPEPVPVPQPEPQPQK